MKIALFYHSLLSDWNHGNAHFLRGIASELVHRGHEVIVHEPENSWSYQNLVAEHGLAPIEAFRRQYPQLKSSRYGEAELDALLGGVDLVVVHEWSTPAVVARIGRWRAVHPEARLLFHDTHHRAVTAPHELAAYDLSSYDGVLAYGEVLGEIYRRNDWAPRIWTWHEAADIRIFRPQLHITPKRDLVWIGNWGDEERSAELREFLIEPCGELRLNSMVHGVRYPRTARVALRDAGILYAGWIANFQVPQAFAQSQVTVHIPRRPYVRRLPGIPTIRPFEALACGIPLVSAPWNDVEGLFTAGDDYLVARSGQEMTRHLRMLMNEPEAARTMATRGHRTILRRHTCGHRVDQLIQICRQLGLQPERNSEGSAPLQTSPSAVV